MALNQLKGPWTADLGHWNLEIVSFKCGVISFQPLRCAGCSVTTPLRGVDMNTVVQMVVQVGQSKTLKEGGLSTRWSVDGRPDGNGCSKGHIVALDKPALFSKAKFFWPKVVKQTQPSR